MPPTSRCSRQPTNRRTGCPTRPPRTATRMKMSCSSRRYLGPENQNNGADSPRRHYRNTCWLLRLVERNDIGRLVLRRLHDRHLSGLAELVDVLVGNAAELDIHHARLHPLAVGVVAYIA